MGNQGESTGITLEASDPGQTTEVQFDRTQFLASMQSIREILVDYGKITESISDTEGWKQKAIRTAHEHRERDTKEGHPLAKMEQVVALFEFLMSQTKQNRFLFHLADHIGELPEFENKELVEYSDLQKQLLPSFDALAKDVALLAEPKGTADPDRVEALRDGVTAFFKALVRQDWNDLNLVMTHLNLVTTSRDSHNLIEQIARIAREIYNSLNQFSEYFTVESLSHSTEELPDAIDKLNSVIEHLEDATNTNLDSLETLNGESRESMAKIKISEGVLANCLEKLEQLVKEQPAMAEGLGEVEQIIREKLQPELRLMHDHQQEYGQIYLDLISNQSFQDLTGQALKKVITFIESLQFKLIELLPNYRELTPDEAKSKTVETGEPKSAMQSQEQVDQMLAELGF